jgi:hypothetical protein
MVFLRLVLTVLTEETFTGLVRCPGVESGIPLYFELSTGPPTGLLKLQPHIREVSSHCQS